MSARDIEQQAASWLARQDAGALPEAEQAALDDWLAQDDRHLGAYIRLRAVWARLDRLGALRPPAPRTQEVAAPAPRLISSLRAGVASATVRRAAAALLLIALGGTLYGVTWRATPKTYDTTIGEMRRLAMDDGSVIEMNTDSEVNVAYSDKSREIWLAHGEGNFTVAKNKERPFIVHVGETTVTAVGTAFSVETIKDGGLRVAVSEGIVAVRRSPDAPPVMVSALQVMRVPRDSGDAVTSDTIIHDASRDEIANQLAWRKGLLVLSGESLTEAASQFNRYNLHQITVTPRAAAAGVRVGGVFQTKDIEGFAKATAASFGLRLIREQNGNMVIDKER